MTDFPHVRQTGLTPGVLLLHGTGADENDLVPLGRAVAPGAALLSARGQVLEMGMPRWFRRLTPHDYDLDDIRVRAAELDEWLARAGPPRPVALGFSNGANMAAAMLLLHPARLGGAALIRANLPVPPGPAFGPGALAGVPVLVANAREDPYRRDGDTEALVSALESAGAIVTVHWSPGGHEMARGDLDAMTEWFAANRSAWAATPAG